jgi:poly(hydroxyalkanoate) depolymerase family esterase
MSSAFHRLWRRVGEALRRTFQPDAEGASAADAQMSAGHFTHQGRSLDYRLYLPPGDARRPRPLLLMLHGCQQNALDFAIGTRMNRHARSYGVIVLYAEQSERANPQRCWNWFKPPHQHRGRGEPGLLAALVGHVKTHYAVDPARVYVAGLSAGGAMADVLAQTHPDLFAAVGIHAGLLSGAAHTAMSAMAVMQNGPTLPLSMALASAPRMRVPAIVFQGDADTTVHPRNAERLVLANLGGDDGAAQEATGMAPGGRSFTQRSYAARAATRADLEFWQVHGAGHAWSGGSTDGSFTDPAGPDASAEMLRFFLAHPAPARSIG